MVQAPAWARLTLVIAWLCVGAGCALSPAYQGAAVAGDLQALRPADGWVVVRDVPLVRQATANDCGVAATEALLRYWRTEVESEQLRQDLKVGPDEPVRARHLKAALRAHGFDAFLVVGRPEDLPRHLAVGRPLLVGMLKPYTKGLQLSHYEIVVGYHPEQGVITMDPGAGWRRYPLEGFEREWSGAGHLMVVAAPSR